MKYFFVHKDAPIPAELQGTSVEFLNQDTFRAWARGKQYFALDTETTGLMPYHGDKVFAIVIAQGDDAVYFDMRGRDKLPDCLLELFGNKDLAWTLHNAKFDLHSLWCTFSLNGLAGQIHDTMVGARLEFNDHFSYSLDACVQRLGNGLVKTKFVEEYIKEHELWEWEEIPGKKIRRKKVFFDKVPLPIMFEYACNDAVITWALGRHQADKITEIDKLIDIPGTPKLADVVLTESQLVPVIVDMETYGVRADLDYCEKAIEHYGLVMASAEEKFTVLTGKEYKASPKLFEEVFANEKEKWSYTKKGNPSFESDVLKRFNSDAANCVLQIRNAKSRIDFFSTFIYFSDGNGFVHPSFNSAGTSTGRFSSSEPNFQNLTDDSENESEKFPVRRAIIPAEPSYCLVSFDYKQQEYALMLDYAGEEDLIEQVKGGADVHQATADLMGVNRKYAKTLNFMLLYGGGVAKLAVALDVTIEKARELRSLYFEKLPKVQQFIRQVMSVAERRGYVYNWAGRRYWCENSEFAYTMPNRVIQGGGADIMKRAMVRIHGELLQNSRTTMALTVHDELVFNMHKDDFHLVPKIKKIMEEVYPFKRLPLRVSVEHSWKSLGDMREGEPTYEDRPSEAKAELPATWEDRFPARGRSLPPGSRAIWLPVSRGMVAAFHGRNAGDHKKGTPQANGAGRGPGHGSPHTRARRWKKNDAPTYPTVVADTGVTAPTGAHDDNLPWPQQKQGTGKEAQPAEGLETLVDGNTLSKIIACYGLPARTVWSHHRFRAEGGNFYGSPRGIDRTDLLARTEIAVLKYNLKRAGVSIPSW